MRVCWLVSMTISSWGAWLAHRIALGGGDDCHQLSGLFVADGSYQSFQEAGERIDGSSIIVRAQFLKRQAGK